MKLFTLGDYYDRRAIESQIMDDWKDRAIPPSGGSFTHITFPTDEFVADKMTEYGFTQDQRGLYYHPDFEAHQPLAGKLVIKP